MTPNLSSCFIVRLLRYSEVTRSPWCLRSPTPRLFFQRTVHIANKCISLESVLQCKIVLSEYARWVLIFWLVWFFILQCISYCPLVRHRLIIQEDILMRLTRSQHPGFIVSHAISSATGKMGHGHFRSRDWRDYPVCSERQLLLCLLSQNF